MKKYILGLVVSVFLVGCGHSVSQDTPEGPIVIGGITPLTGDGAVYGELIQESLAMRIDEINSEGGVDGRAIEILWEDGKCTPKDASFAAQKLINVDNVPIIIGVTCSGEILGAAPITEKNKVVMVASTGGSTEISDAGEYIFRLTPSNDLLASILAQHANEKGYGKISMLVEQTDAGTDLARRFVSEFEGEVVEEKFLSMEADFKNRITKIKAEEADALIVFVQTASKFDLIMKQLQEQKWEGVMLVNDVISSDPNTVKPYADFFATNSLIGADFRPEGEELNIYIQKYEDLYGAPPLFGAYMGTTIDSLDILVKALEKVKNERDTDALSKYMYNMRPHKGLTGIFTYDERGDGVGFEYMMVEFEGEEFSPIEQ